MLPVGVVLSLVGGTLLFSWLVPVLRAGDCRGGVVVASEQSFQRPHQIKQLMYDEIWAWARLAGPVLCANILNQSMTLTDISVLGHLASDEQLSLIHI